MLKHTAMQNVSRQHMVWRPEEITFRNGSISSVVAGQSDYALVWGDCLKILKTISDDSIDCVVTSPPYFQQRDYDLTREEQKFAIGGEKRVGEYVEKLTLVFDEVKRVMSPHGSFWLNIGDKYINKDLAGVPWRVALAMKDRGWILRDDIIWNQLKGTQSVKDRMRDVYEHVFHFVKSKQYYFDGDRIRIKPRNGVSLSHGMVISATGVSGRKYRSQIEKSDLSGDEKKAAIGALDAVIKEMQEGKVVDFRMTIRGFQRIYHSESNAISGRAKELEDKGFFILKMWSKGHLPSNIWDIVPEDKWRKDSHCAVYPEALLEIPIKATCPNGGIVLDPFVGTGSSISAALNYGCKGIGIDLSNKYLNIARARIEDGH